jgi:hypothetical protein
MHLQVRVRALKAVFPDKSLNSRHGEDVHNYGTLLGGRNVPCMQSNHDESGNEHFYGIAKISSDLVSDDPMIR